MRRALLVLALSNLALAHPMGNFSVNHYAKLEFGATGAQLTYVLDLAEIPTFELMQQWGIDWHSNDALAGKASQQAAAWLANVSIAQNGRPAILHTRSVTPKAVAGAAGMPVLRIVIVADAELKPGAAEYEDRNFEGRAGWKEIVIDHGAGAKLSSATRTSQDLSAGLTRYPADPSVTPPQDVKASVVWSPVAQMAPRIPTSAAVPEAPPAQEVGAPSFTAQQPKAPGTVTAGDFLSRLLQHRQIGWELALAGLLAAFGLGAVHAMSPGHGKTIVAAYLVGSRGTLRHAGLLGFVVTFTHTFTVFLLGLGVLFFQQYIVPERIVPALGAISGMSIVVVGAMLLYRRAAALLHGHSHGHHHHHHHHHDHHHHGHEHSHDGHTHSHDMPEKITPGSLIALGVSGGLVPCPSALVLMLSAIALGHPGLGSILLVGFSSGLASVLMGIGVVAVYARHLLPSSESAMKRPLFQLIPVFSAVVVIFLGLAVTAVSAGWVQPLRFLA
jgi:ABC-type nickel/cobalt efflux system permease component RcnA